MKVVPDFENRLKEIDSDLSIRKSEGREVAGIYWRNYSLDISVPTEDIYEEPNANYGLDIGDKFVLHRTSEMALKMVKATLKRMAEEPEFYDLVTSSD